MKSRRVSESITSKCRKIARGVAKYNMKKAGYTRICSSRLVNALNGGITKTDSVFKENWKKYVE